MDKDMSKYDISINGRRYEIEVTLRKDSGDAAVSGAGAEYEVKVNETASPAVQAQASPSAQARPAVQARAADQAPQASSPATQPAADSGGNGKPVTAPLPGVILQICVNEGQQVRRGQKVAVLEAMKMENDILADADGIVGSILVQKGDSVLEDSTIMTIQQ